MSRNPDNLLSTIGAWVLEGHRGSDAAPSRFALREFPCRVGRVKGVEIVIPFSDVSGQHAELFLHDSRLFVRDMGSTNGTFVNRERLDQPHELRPGDVIHFGQREFRVICEQPQPTASATVAIQLQPENLPSRLATGTRELVELLRDGSIEPHFQPVIDLRDGRIVGHEILGRGAHLKLPKSPGELFRVAAAVGAEVQLSELFRNRGVQVAQRLAGNPELFFNTHPEEMLNLERLVSSLSELRASVSRATLVLEVHESAVLAPDSMRQLRDHLDRLQIGLAYDDFGAGRARLVELLDVPPDVLKFDLAIIRDLHLASSAKRSMLESLVTMLIGQEIRCLAEGIETAEEADSCRELGFDLAQGYYFGRPQPIENWAECEPEVSREAARLP